MMPAAGQSPNGNGPSSAYAPSPMLSQPVPAPARRPSSAALRPVPKPGSRLLKQSSADANPRHADLDVRWRRSPQVQSATAAEQQRPPAKSSFSAETFGPASIAAQASVPAASIPTASLRSASSAQPDTAAPAANQLRQAGSVADLHPMPVRQVALLTQPPGAPAGPLPDAEQRQPSRGDEEPDFFSNPFAAPPSAPAPDVSELPAPNQAGENELRPPGELPIEPIAPPTEARPIPDGPSLGDMLRENQPPPRETPPDSPLRPDVRPEPNDLDAAPPQESPSDLQPFNENPFERARDRAPEEPSDFLDDQQRNSRGITCEEFRDRIAAQTIRQVSLDISPPFRPDVIAEDEFEVLKQRFNEAQPIRQWRSIDGRELATGRLRDLAYEQAIIETEHDTVEELPLDRLSEADLAFISQKWGLPKECLLEQVAYEPRMWVPLTMTWRASNLCHKPLYFEEVNLERYGHTAGPFLQPLVSSAHFFANIAVLPYKMGVHAPTECQYALGYYRPGNCAPWIIPPVPLSLRGGLTQAAAMTGTFWLVP